MQLWKIYGFFVFHIDGKEKASRMMKDEREKVVQLKLKLMRNALNTRFSLDILLLTRYQILCFNWHVKNL